MSAVTSQRPDYVCIEMSGVTVDDSTDSAVDTETDLGGGTLLDPLQLVAQSPTAPPPPSPSRPRCQRAQVQHSPPGGATPDYQFPPLHHYPHYYANCPAIGYLPNPPQCPSPYCGYHYGYPAGFPQPDQRHEAAKNFHPYPYSPCLIPDPFYPYNGHPHLPYPPYPAPLPPHLPPGWSGYHLQYPLPPAPPPPPGAMTSLPVPAPMNPDVYWTSRQFPAAPQSQTPQNLSDLNASPFPPFHVQTDSRPAAQRRLTDNLSDNAHHQVEAVSSRYDIGAQIAPPRGNSSDVTRSQNGGQYLPQPRSTSSEGIGVSQENESENSNLPNYVPLFPTNQRSNCYPAEPGIEVTEQTGPVPQVADGSRQEDAERREEGKEGKKQKEQPGVVVVKQPPAVTSVHGCVLVMAIVALLFPLFGVPAIYCAVTARRRARSTDVIKLATVPRLIQSSIAYSIGSWSVLVCLAVGLGLGLGLSSSGSAVGQRVTRATAVSDPPCPTSSTYYYVDGVCYPYRLPTPTSQRTCLFGRYSRSYCYYDSYYVSGTGSPTISCDAGVGADRGEDGYCYYSSSVVCQHSTNYIGGVCYKYALPSTQSACQHGVYLAPDGVCFYQNRSVSSYCGFGDKAPSGLCYYNDS